jgi:hypothetical protein
MITTKVIADSINPAGDRITTGLWTYPRFIHSEVMTHRMLAKNSASSRAIPVEKMIAAVRENPATFEQYGAANKGMSAEKLLDPLQQSLFQDAWMDARNYCLRSASDVRELAAKQLVNRMLEPWMHMTVIVTGTDWNNFFALRAHPAAQPEFQVLAYRWLADYLESVPVKKNLGEWHLPLTTDEDYYDRLTGPGELRKQISVARCARVSYVRHDADDTLEACSRLHDRLLEQGHMSPFEHQAQAAVAEHGGTDYFGCYRGWKPYRKFWPNENRTNVNLQELLANKPDWITL